MPLALAMAVRLSPCVASTPMALAAASLAGLEPELSSWTSGAMPSACAMAFWLAGARASAERAPATSRWASASDRSLRRPTSGGIPPSAAMAAWLAGWSSASAHSAAAASRVSSSVPACAAAINPDEEIATFFIRERPLSCSDARSATRSEMHPARARPPWLAGCARASRSMARAARAEASLSDEPRSVTSAAEIAPSFCAWSRASAARATDACSRALSVPLERSATRGGSPPAAAIASWLGGQREASE